MRTFSSLRLILGDQLNSQHSWFKKADDNTLFVMMEVRSETDYVKHHVQKVVGIFDAMRNFSATMSEKGFHFYYIKINDSDNQHAFLSNISALISRFQIQEVHYQQPDEYRLAVEMNQLQKELGLPVFKHETEHFLVETDEIASFFPKKGKSYIMEAFYRKMRLKYNILLDGSKKPLGGKWNFDQENRKKVPSQHHIFTTSLHFKNVTNLLTEIQTAGIETIGEINPTQFSWTTTREEALDLLSEFVDKALPYFGTLQDAMTKQHWYLYHSRLSFALNTKMLHPLEVITAVEKAHFNDPETYSLNQVEGFIRQILGWREFMRGIYWSQMPEFASLNFFNHQRKLPSWFWTGKTKMNCLHLSIKQSLSLSYAHHIQRLMITGNFCLLAGIHPDEVDDWYLGIYVDAFEWVEITNTRGMSQFADGGIVGSKPYISSASYIHKMSDYCGTCHYKHDKKTGENACPFNTLYWHFIDKNVEKLVNNPRMSMMINLWKKTENEQQNAILQQAEYYITNLENL